MLNLCDILAIFIFCLLNICVVHMGGIGNFLFGKFLLHDISLRKEKMEYIVVLFNIVVVLPAGGDL